MVNQRKLKVLIHTDWSLSKTGFGKSARNLLTYLYKTGKYELVHYCCNIAQSNPDTQKTPWKSIGCLPDNNEIQHYLSQFPTSEEREYRMRQMCYGDYSIDRVIRAEKPDVYIGTQDIWGVEYSIGKPWFSKINSVIWTTLDSLPLLPSAVQHAPKIPNYWIWSSFATKELHRLGHTHVKTVHGPLEDKWFYRLSDEQRKTLRARHNIPEDTFVIGFVFRNQLRKSVPNLLEGYKIWKTNNPGRKSALLFHTHFSEGWNIHKLAEEYGVDKSEILTTYACRNCKGYEVKPFVGQDQDCNICRCAKAQITTNVGFGVDETQLNEVYNLMDVYCHPFTSGGQEIPIQEAKLTELVTLVTNYSCGEELCEEGSGSIPLSWSEYREHGTEFRKASTDPHDIARKIEVVYQLPLEERQRLGAVARKYILDSFSVKAVGAQIEAMLDSFRPTEYNFEDAPDVKSPHANTADIEEIDDDSKFIIECYKRILNMTVDEKDSGAAYWLNILKNTP